MRSCLPKERLEGKGDPPVGVTSIHCLRIAFSSPVLGRKKTQWEWKSWSPRSEATLEPDSALRWLLSSCAAFSLQSLLGHALNPSNARVPSTLRATSANACSMFGYCFFQNSVKDEANNLLQLGCHSVCYQLNYVNLQIQHNVGSRPRLVFLIRIWGVSFCISGGLSSGKGVIRSLHTA